MKQEKIKILKFIIFAFVILFSADFVFAADCADKNYRCNSSKDNFIVHPTIIREKINGKIYEIFVLQRQYTKSYVYCLQKGKPAPHVAHKLTNPNYCTTSNSFVAENVRAAVGYVINSGYGYANKQKVIHQLMHEAGIGEEPPSYNESLYTAAKNIRDEYYNASPQVTLTNFTLSGDNYVASYSITGASGLGDPTISVNIGSVSNGQVYVPKTTQATDGVINVTISVSYTKNYNLAITKTCGDYQPIAEASTTPKSKTYSDTASKQIKIDTCETEFDAKKVNGVVSMADRIYLYNKYYKANNDIRNMLNSTETTAKDACTPVNSNKQDENSCLTSKLDNVDFSVGNLSNYNQKYDTSTSQITINSKQMNAFCLNSLEFKNQVPYDDVTNKKYITNSGRLLLKTDTGVATNLTFTKTCYVYDPNSNNAPINEVSITLGNLTDYINTVTLTPGEGSGLKTEDMTLTASDNPVIELSGSNGFYTSTVNVDYKLPLVYANNGSGKKHNGTCNICKKIGYGILTKLNQDENNTINFSYNGFWGLKTATCNYEINQKIIIKEKLGLEFRTISTNNPFPGISGSGRKIGENWWYIDATSGHIDKGVNNPLITEEILNSPNSYGLIPKTNAKQDPKYVIGLHPELIRKIRDYNKGKSYDDYNLTCVANGENCTSSFLREFLKNDIEIN